MCQGSAELFQEVAATVRSWSPEKLRVHGFDLIFRGSDSSYLRRQHARTVLVGEHLLNELGSLGIGPVILMKGLEVAQLYPDPVDRPFRDVDLLVRNAQMVWQHYLDLGYRQDLSHGIDIDHHHLPALADPTGVLGIEFHHRPNLPAWVRLDNHLVFDTAGPSRTGIVGIQRPRDDLHALLMAMHCWKGGFARLRDLLDALLLASVSALPVEETADELGLGRFWRWTVRFAEAELMGRSTFTTRTVARVILPRRPRVADWKWSRVFAPYLVANPVRVSLGHLADYRLGRDARRASPDDSRQPN